MVICGIFFSLLNGILQGLIPEIIGDGTQQLGTKTGNDRVNAARGVTYKCVGIGFAAMFVACLSKMLWSLISQNIENKIRKDFFKKLLEQDCAWYDILSADKVTTIYNMEGNNYVKGLGASNSMLMFSVGQLLVGVILAISTAIIYTFICLALVPIMIVGLGLMMYAITAGATLSKASYVKAGSSSEQAIAGIRTVKSLCGEEREFGLYKKSIEDVKKILIRFGFIKGIGFGAMFACLF